MVNWQQELSFQQGKADPVSPLSGISTIKQWERRREAILQAAQELMYGQIPPIPEEVVAEGMVREEPGMIRHFLTFKAGPGDGITFSATLTRPVTDLPVPVIVGNGDTRWLNVGHDVGTPRGYAVITFNRVDIAPDNNSMTGQAHRCFKGQDIGTLAFWAWGHFAINTWLQTQAFADKAKIAATGHSRGGKTALIASLFDPRIAVALVAGSGCGGMGLFRGLEGRGQYVERLKGITSAFPYWFKSDFNQFAEREQDLPFDQHLLRAALAPRPCLTTDATGDVWVNNLGTMRGWELSNEVYALYGKPENNGVAFRTGGHAHNIVDWTAMVDFCDMVLFNKVSPTDYYHPIPASFEAPWEK